MSIVEKARGRWTPLLKHFGIEFKVKRHGPCPICGGKDRFIVDDKEGLGTFHCNQCGAGTGFTLLQKVKGWDMKQTMLEVSKIVGGMSKMEIKPEQSDEQRRKALNEVWTGARDITDDDPAYTYIYARTGLVTIPKSLRYHTGLYHPDAKGNLPAIVAKVSDLDNRPVSIHRSFITAEGEKAKVDRPKMLMQGALPDGAAIRLFPYQESIGVAEGIETAISCFAIFGIPTWAAISSAMLVKWTPPSVVKRVYIFGDNDDSLTGQLAAYRLGWALKNNKTLDVVRVMIPDIRGADWNDVLRLHGSTEARLMYKDKLD